ncbi:MAG: DUF1616 domain-containing protein [Thermoplasmata archaeon]
MTDFTGLEIVAGILLLFFVPGYFVTKATFPEWRVRGENALVRAIEIGTLSFVLSVVLTVLVGYSLLVGGPQGFQSAWSDPELEAILFAIAIVAFGVGAARGAYRSTPPVRAPAPAPGEDRPFELARELAQLDREEKRLRRELDRAGTTQPRAELERQLGTVRARRTELQRRREAEYAA